jgi:fatty-acyl-CoA synthase
MIPVPTPVTTPRRRYWNDNQDTGAAFRNGFFRTGDIGYQDADSYFFILDRSKDVIVTGGENVYCGEVEAVISGIQRSAR